MEALQAIAANVPKGFIAGLMNNGLAVALAYLLVWKIFNKPLKNWRIQIRERADAQQIKSEIKNAVFVFLVGACSSSVVLYLHTLGYGKIYEDAADYSPFWAIAGFFLIWIIDDAWFYWVHRLLHHRSIYHYIHAVHHQSIDVNPFSSMSFHWVEAFLLSSWIFPISFIMPTYLPALGVMQIVGLINNIKAHLGYELYPAGLNKGWFRFLAASTHHNMHHSKFKGNYGLHFRFWDKVCGTEFRDYETVFDQIQTRKQGKLSKLHS
jgi:Delta7-sterol 5-desaturase